MIRSSIILVSLMLGIWSAQAAELLGADSASAKARTGELLLIDIRRPDEWSRSGVAASAYKNSMHQQGFLQNLSVLTNGDKDAPIALICATGKRSTWMSAELQKRGYTNVLNVREGMMGSQDGPGWLARGLPVKH